jgi:Flp pilus assembly protein TadG/beta-lactam-binding protein with PASTA domain
LIKLPWRRSRVPRGQALVEFALILPILALFLIMALDFGRVFFGWVGITNASRIGANYASAHADSWATPDSPAKQQVRNTYYTEVASDLEALNCSVPDYDGDGKTNRSTSLSASQQRQEMIQDLKAAPGTDVTPQFTNLVDTPDPHDFGDNVSVRLTCNLALLTPLANGFFGGGLNLAGVTAFSIKGGEIAGIPVGPPPPPPGCVDKTVPNMVGQAVSVARTQWTSAGFTGAFTPATGSDTETVLTQTTSPVSHPGDCLVATATVTVTSSPSGCTAPQIKVPNLVGLTVANARTAWSGAGFTGSFSPPTGFNDPDTVTGQTTNPATVVGACANPSTTVTVTHVPPSGSCIMPQLIGLKVNNAQAPYNSAGFTGTFTATTPPNGNYTVQTQSLVGGQTYPCSSSVTVGG